MILREHTIISRSYHILSHFYLFRKANSETQTHDRIEGTCQKCVTFQKKTSISTSEIKLNATY